MTAYGGKMAKAKAWEVTDDFWKRVEPLIPKRQRVTIPRQSRGPSLMGRSKRLIEHQGSRDYSYCFSSPQTARPRRSQPPNAKHEIPNRRLTRLFATSHIHRSRGTCSALPSGKSRPIPVKVKLLLPPRQSRGISFVGLVMGRI